jgi:hypothetical protein
LLVRPTLDLGPEPELGAAASEVDDRSWHVGVTPLVETDAVPVREAKEAGDAVGIHKIVCGDKSTHICHKATSVDRRSVRDLR